MDLPSITFLIFVAALAGLVVSSHFFVGGAASLAKHLGMTPAVIGLTIVAFGTSAPEILVSASAALEGSPALGVGNALGSNIANVGLVLGITALIARLPVQRGMFRIEIPILVFATSMAAIFLYDATLTRLEGSILLLSALAFPFVFVWDARRLAATEHPGVVLDEIEAEDIPDLSLIHSWLWLILGLCALLLSADQLVASATDIALHFEVSPLVIGVTIVAIGTSLPELATSMVSALKGHKEMAVGNIIGSNILNIFAVMAMPGLLAPATLESEVFSRDTTSMCLITVVMLLCIALATRKKNQETSIGWKTGIVFLGLYLSYTAIIIL